MIFNTNCKRKRYFAVTRSCVALRSSTLRERNQLCHKSDALYHSNKPILLVVVIIIVVIIWYLIIVFHRFGWPQWPFTLKPSGPSLSRTSVFLNRNSYTYGMFRLWKYHNMNYDQTNDTKNLTPGADKNVVPFLIHPLLHRKNPFFLILVSTL